MTSVRDFLAAIVAVGIVGAWNTIVRMHVAAQEVRIGNPTQLFEGSIHLAVYIVTTGLMATVALRGASGRFFQLAAPWSVGELLAWQDLLGAILNLIATIESWDDFGEHLTWPVGAEVRQL